MTRLPTSVDNMLKRRQRFCSAGSNVLLFHVPRRGQIGYYLGSRATAAFAGGADGRSVVFETQANYVSLLIGFYGGLTQLRMNLATQTSKQ